MTWTIILAFALLLFHHTVLGFKPTKRVLETYTNHPCIRDCRVGDSRICSYEFHIEYYHTMSKACYGCPGNVTDCYRPHCVPADGRKRTILSVNRMLPGPAIHVCQNDTIVVKVHNELVNGEGTSIHWHGIHMHGSPHMDGVSMVTQCPIIADTSFEYRFKPEPAGTHFWHAHTGLQRAEGVYGALVVRQPPEFEPQLGLYDEDLPEHTILVQDWLVELVAVKYARHYHAGGDNRPKTVLINGKGQRMPDDHQSISQTPLDVFRVSRGRRYRFRTISNGILFCPIQISIDNHTLTMIASDGSAFHPKDVRSFVIHAGERYDFVVTATGDVDNYWVRAVGLADCETKHAKQLAILHYDGAPDVYDVTNSDWSNAEIRGKQLNPLNHPGTEDLIPVTNLTSLEPPNRHALQPVPDKRLHLAMDFWAIDNYHYQDEALYPLSAVDDAVRVYMPQVNRISMRLPSSPPLTQMDDLDQDIFCNEDVVRGFNCSDQFCECVHLIQAALGDVIEVIMVDEGVIYNASHPMHLHGHRFYVVGIGKLNDTTTLEKVKQLDSDELIPRNLVNPVAKDTVTIPDGGYAIIRFQANNPGFWYFHCHLEFHVGIGMGLLLQTGNVTDMPSAPQGFHTCGNWEPTRRDLQGEAEPQYSETSGGISKYTRTELAVLYQCICNFIILKSLYRYIY